MYQFQPHEVPAYLEMRRKVLKPLSAATTSTQILKLWPVATLLDEKGNERLDWAALSAFLEISPLTPKVYEELAKIDNWFIQFLLCKNKGTLDPVLYQLARLDPKKPLPSSTAELYDVEGGGAQELKAKNDISDIRKLAFAALQERAKSARQNPERRQAKNPHIQKMQSPWQEIPYKPARPP